MTGTDHDWVNYVVRWRVGKKLGRTIYACDGIAANGEYIPDNDTLLGLMETKEIAAEVVRLHNDYIDMIGTSWFTRHLRSRSNRRTVR